MIATRPKAPRAFTLIELLIVVAIIAILAAIAVPNFLQAQVRAKVSRAKSDLRTMATALESYHIDNGSYVEFFQALTGLSSLTTPISYISQVPRDVFQVDRPNLEGLPDLGPMTQAIAYMATLYSYGGSPLAAPQVYVIASIGPDTDLDTYLDGQPDPLALRVYRGWNPDLFSEDGMLMRDGQASGYETVPEVDVADGTRMKFVPYDPTNGVISSGDIYRFSDKLAE